MDNLNEIFTADVLKELFPPQRADDFFEALFGDAGDGAYDISLSYMGYDEHTHSLIFNLDLHERPGCCLACNLTYGLPEVFSRHPVIDVSSLVAAIEKKLDGQARCTDWELGATVQQEKNLHSIPLHIRLA